MSILNMQPLFIGIIGCMVAMLGLIQSGQASDRYLWLNTDGDKTIEQRVIPPNGYKRIPYPPDSFGNWLRNLPLKKGRPLVYLYNGQPKSSQTAHFAVIDMDIGTKNLLQCADAVIRLRAEYLFSTGCTEKIVFKFTSGDAAKWMQWQKGFRPKISGQKVLWVKTAAPDHSYRNFNKYLETVYMYAGSYSLSRELVSVNNPMTIEIGDVFIQGGFPGHAVLVVDVAENEKHDRMFLLAQSYMPAQQVHLLKNFGHDSSPWYKAHLTGTLQTPEWRFEFSDLKRFQNVNACRQP